MISQNGTNIKLIKIWLVDDHQVYREIFKNLIESFDPAFKVIKLAENSKEVLELLRKYYHTELKPDILILVMELDKYDGFWYLDNVKPQYPDIKILAQTNKSDSLTKNRLSKYNVQDPITKQTEVNEVKTAVLKIISGETYFPQNQMSNNDEMDTELFSTLTKRELEFVELSCTTMKYHEIAEKMHIAYKALDGYREKVFKKFNIHSRSELVDLISKSKQ